MYFLKLNIHFYKELFFIALFSFLSYKNYAQETEQPKSGKQVVSSFLSQVNEKETRYLVYLPQNYDSLKKNNPLMIFLPGIDQIGSDINLLLKYGPPKLAGEGKQFPMIIISLQQGHFVGKNYEPRFHTGLIHELIQHAIKAYNVDTSRIYMSGLSMGGNGCWRYAIDYPRVLAAMVPICGQTYESETKRDLKKSACDIKDIPTRVFHGATDQMIDVNHSIEMVSVLDSCKPLPRVLPQLTVYENTGHDSWTRTYANITGEGNIYSWMLEHSNKSYNPASSKPVPINSSIKPKGKGQLRKVAKMPAALKESSGLVVSNKNKIWTHNDSGNAPVLFAIDSTGKILETKRIVGAANVDWEDITRDERFFYIGDFGNNSNNRRSLQIYKIPNPDSVKEERIKAETIEFYYPDQIFPTPESKRNYDVEAIVSLNDSLYLFTKNRTKPFNGFIYLYKLPKTPGSYVAEKTDSLFLGKGNMIEYWVTSASLSPGKKKLILLSQNKMWIFTCFTGNKFFKGKKSMIEFTTFSQREAVGFLNEDEIVLTDEEAFPLSEGNLYFFNISNYVNDPCHSK